MTGDAADMIVIAMKENRGGSGSALNKKSGEVNIERISDFIQRDQRSRSDTAFDHGQEADGEVCFFGELFERHFLSKAKFFYFLDQLYCPALWATILPISLFEP